MKKIASICMNSGPERSLNMARACDFITEAAHSGAEWIVLPELFSYMGPYKNLYDNAEDASSPNLQKIADLARRHQVTIVAGSMPERPENEAALQQQEAPIRKVYNSSFVFGPGGDLVAKYSKCHLFALWGRERQNVVCEADGFYPGNEVVRFEHEGLSVGLAICYDLRFPEFFLHMTKTAPIDVLIVPAAFTYKTGKDHWLLLLKARAVELQCYVVAANQCGTHPDQPQTYGHSAIISPWGEVLAETGESEAIIYHHIDSGYLAEVRTRLAVLQHKRWELYR
jgi:predicted amidohydrolase